MQNWENRTLYHGDNLPFLRNLNSESVHLIATDPPFNKGRDFHATPDSLAEGASFQDRWTWEKDVHQEWVDQITDDFPKLMEAIESARYAHSDGMGAFMCFMSVRLLEMHRILRKDGSIYLHCDPTASHYLKAIMDAIFGWKQFRNEIVWCYTGASNTPRWFPRKHDTIFWYCKSQDSPFYRDSIRIPYNPETMARKGRADDSWFTNQKRTGAEVQAMLGTGKVPEDWWAEIPKLTNQRERYGYPTQKPLALYERIIKASSSEGDVVLDPFCGCATTLVAAERLNRQWIGADIWDKSIHAVIDRFHNEQLKVSEEKQAEWLLVKGGVDYTTDLPIRTDEGQEVMPFLRVKETIKEPGPKMSRAEMYEHLLKQDGSKCQGCDRVFDDKRYLQLDHNTPRSDRGLNHISNRILLCGPCNNLKSNTYTLSGLRRENNRRSYMAPALPL